MNLYEDQMQMCDVAGIMRNGYDEKYVEEWAKKLGVEDLLIECRELLAKNYVDGHDS